MPGWLVAVAPEITARTRGYRMGCKGRTGRSAGTGWAGGAGLSYTGSWPGPPPPREPGRASDEGEFMSEPTDRRAAERLPVSAGTSCSFVSPVVVDFGAARVRDISLNGVGLILSRKVEVGTVLVVGIANESKGLAKTMIVRVIHATPIPGGFLVGGEFATPLTYAEFTSLVM